MRLLCLLLLFAGCASEKPEDLPEHLAGIENLIMYPATQEPSGEIEIARDLSFTDNDDVFFGRMVDNIAVDDSGRVFIADLEENTVHTFDSDGSYLRRFGRSGQGPGEFEFISDLAIGGGAIHILEPLRFRITLFDLESLEYIGQHDISLENRQDNQPEWLEFTREEQFIYRPSKLFVRPDGTYVLLFYDGSVGALDNIDGRTYEVSVYDPETDEFQHDVLSFEYTGQILIHEVGETRMAIFRVPYKRHSLFDYSNGKLVHGWSEEMLFRYYDKNGEYQSAFYHSHRNMDLTMNDVLTFYDGAGDQLISAIRSDEQPDTWPAIRSLTLDDENRLWVSTFTDGMDHFEWKVLDEQGRLIATFLWPRNRELKVVKNGLAYTMERDFETGRQDIVRYSIDFEN